MVTYFSEDVGHRKPPQGFYLGPASVPGRWSEGLALCIGGMEGAGPPLDLISGGLSSINLTGGSSPTFGWGTDDDNPYMEYRNGAFVRFPVAQGGQWDGTFPYTQAFRMRWPSSGGFLNIFGDDKHAARRNGIWANMLADGDARFVYGDNTGNTNNDNRVIDTTSTPFADNDWHTIVCIRTGATTADIYTDGVAEASKSTTGSGGAVGYNDDGPFVGSIAQGADDDFDFDVGYIWHRGLELDEVLELTRDPYAPIRSSWDTVIAAAAAGGIIPQIMHHRRMLGVS